MICIKDEHVYGRATIRRVVLLSDTTPGTLPTSGANVDNLPDNVEFAPGSTLICLDTSSKYIAGEDGSFKKWN